MKQENTGLLLVLLLVFGGVLYPQLGGTGKDGGASGAAGKAATPTPNTYLCDRDAEGLVDEFLRVEAPPRKESPAPQLSPQELRDVSAPPLEFLIATVPDPVDSQLGGLFDEYLDAIQRAISVSGYLLDRYSLPWQCAREVPRGETGMARLHERQPGVMLFRSVKGPGLLVLFLVGELPTTGVQKMALAGAFAQIAILVRGGPERVRIVGPAFSGSTASLAKAVEGWCGADNCPEHYFRIVSGSATYPGSLGKLPSVDFRGTVATIKEQSDVMYKYLQDIGATQEETALLVEGDTAYGQAGARESQSTPTWQPSLRLPFPLQVSQVRSAYERSQLLTKPSGNAEKLTPDVSRALELSLEATGQPRDVVPAFAPNLASNYADLIVASMLSTISRERYRFVGIQASDARDKLFLAHRIREFCPDVRLFTFGSDLLYVHPTYNLDLDGMIVASTYPLYGENQEWAGGSAGRRVQFATNGVQGTYNATLLLLNYDTNGRAALPSATPPQLLDYAPPVFGGARTEGAMRPPVWLTVVGHGSVWPLRFAPGPVDPNGYVLPVWRAAASEDESTQESPTSWTILLAAVSIFCLLNCAAFMVTTASKSGRRLPSVIDRFNRTIVLRAVTCPQCRRSQSLLVLAGLVTLLLTYSLLAPIALVPVRLAWSGTSSAGDIPGWWCGVVFTWVVLLLTVLVAGTRAINRRGSAANAADRTCAHGKVSPAHPLWSVACGALLVLGVLAAGYLGYRGMVEPLDTAALQYERATNTASGVSMVPPVLFFAAGFYLWALCHVRRVYLIETAGVPLPLEGDTGAVADLAQSIRCALQRSLRIGAAVVALPLCVVPWAVLFLRFLPTFEGWAFDWVCIVAALLYLLAVAFSFSQFLAVWARMKLLLEQLAAHPIAAALRRLPPRPRGMMSGRFSASAPTLRDVALWMQQWRLVVKNFEAVAEQVRLVLGDSALWSDVKDCIASAPQLEAQFVVEQRQAAEGGRAAIARSPTRRCLSHAARALAHVLAVFESLRGTSVPPKEQLLRKLEVTATTPTSDVYLQDVSAPLPLWLRQAEDFVALQVATYTSALFSQLRNLVAFVTLSVVLMLLAFASYPFEPQQLLMYFVWALLTVVTIGSVVVFVQVERDHLLSCIAGTDPNKVEIDWQFVSRIFTYGVLPLLTLIATQFPQLGRFLGGIFQVIK